MWSNIQIKKHRETAELLNKIKDEAFKFINSSGDGVSEKEVQDFILKKFKENNLESDKDKPIVAFRENSAIPHHSISGKGKLLVKNSLILIDIWANIKNSEFPFADITWMAFYGDKVPKEVQKVFDKVIKSRNKALDFIKSELKKGNLPAGKEVDKIAREVINKAGFEGKFIHGTGHSLGTKSPHGEGSNLNSKGEQKILVNMGYTIEPGVYLEGKFGVRSEIDFYVNNKMDLIVTTPVQDKIVII